MDSVKNLLDSKLNFRMRDVKKVVKGSKGIEFPKPLSAEQERFLVEQLNVNREYAGKVLVETNLRLVVHLVKKFRRPEDSDWEDFISIGTMGLIKGVNTFNPGKNTRLATYAARCIENEIFMHLRGEKKQKQVVSLRKVVSHDEDGNGLELQDILYQEYDTQYEILENKEMSSLVRKAIELLGEKQQKVLRLYFNINEEFTEREVDNKEGLTQEQIALLLGISRSYVSRILRNGVKNFIRFFLTLENGGDWDEETDRIFTKAVKNLENRRVKKSKHKKLHNKRSTYFKNNLFEAVEETGVAEEENSGQQEEKDTSFIELAIATEEIPQQTIRGPEERMDFEEGPGKVEERPKPEDVADIVAVIPEPDKTEPAARMIIISPEAKQYNRRGRRPGKKSITDATIVAPKRIIKPNLPGMSFYGSKKTLEAWGNEGVERHVVVISGKIIIAYCPYEDERTKMVFAFVPKMYADGTPVLTEKTKELSLSGCQLKLSKEESVPDQLRKVFSECI